MPICKPLWLAMSNHKFYGDVEKYNHMMIGDELIVIPYLNKNKEIKLNFQESKFYNVFNGKVLTSQKDLDKLLDNDTIEKQLSLLAIGGSVLFMTDETG